MCKLWAGTVHSWNSCLLPLKRNALIFHHLHRSPNLCTQQMQDIMQLFKAPGTVCDAVRVITSVFNLPSAILISCCLLLHVIHVLQ